jgi:hypothetical protein
VTSKHLVFASKSPWYPAIRREHALAREAVHAGYLVDFVEQPEDVRSVGRLGPRGYLMGLRGSQRSEALPGGLLRVSSRSTVLPGHMREIGLRSNTALLRRVLSKISTPESTLVCQAPWDWEAVHEAPAARRVFDCTDDWAELLPGRAKLVREAYSRIATEADVVVVVNPSLMGDFPGAQVALVRNGVSDALLRDEAAPRPRQQRMVYVGTLSERFDVSFVRELLTLLPGWSLDLYGQCQYAGLGNEPSPELSHLLDDPELLVRWHGVVNRDGIGAAIDAADVAVVLNKPELSRGQSSMKVFDYAARGRPIVTMVPEMATPADAPPGILTATTPSAYAAQVLAASRESDSMAVATLRWAAANTWSARWRDWSMVAIAAPREQSAAPSKMEA